MRLDLASSPSPHRITASPLEVLDLEDEVEQRLTIAFFSAERRALLATRSGLALASKTRRVNSTRTFNCQYRFKSSRQQSWRLGEKAIACIMPPKKSAGGYRPPIKSAAKASSSKLPDDGRPSASKTRRPTDNKGKGKAAASTSKPPVSAARYLSDEASEEDDEEEDEDDEEALSLVDPEEEPQPSFLENWLRMWRGPEELP